MYCHNQCVIDLLCTVRFFEQVQGKYKRQLWSMKQNGQRIINMIFSWMHSQAVWSNEDLSGLDGCRPPFTSTYVSIWDYCWPWRGFITSAPNSKLIWSPELALSSICQIPETLKLQTYTYHTHTHLCWIHPQTFQIKGAAATIHSSLMSWNDA